MRNSKFSRLFFGLAIYFGSQILSADVLDAPVISSLNEKSKKYEDLQAASYTQSPHKRKTNKYYSEKRALKQDKDKRKNWKPFFAEYNYFQTSNSILFQGNIGLGLLYFNRVRGNLMGTPRGLFTNNWNDGPIRGSLNYNRTPLFEYIAGYRFFRIFKLGLSFQHQSSVSVQTGFIPAGVANATSSFMFMSNLELDALMLKAYVDLPWPIVMKDTMTNLYFGSAIGPGWQSWTNNRVVRIDGTNAFYNTALQPLKAKYYVNPVWTLDAGLRVQGIGSLASLSVVAGCKFNLWGRSGNIGKISQQDSLPLGLQNPFNSRRLYQWAPYLGLQWNFPDFCYLPRKQRLQDQQSQILTQLNVGVGLLYFRNVRGNLISKPSQNQAAGISYTTNWLDSPVNKVDYNRTPLLEYLVLHRFNSYLQLGVSYQNQSGIVVQTPAVHQTNATLSGSYAQLTANLNLDALLVKAYAIYPDLYTGNTIKIAPYFGFGFGPSWQSWTRIGVLRIFNATGGITGGDQPIRQKISANCMVNLDWGVRVGSSNPNYRFSLTAGCKYNAWGQAKNIGLDTQQGTYKLAINEPLRIKKINQWAPYLGVQWTFPSTYNSKKPYYLDGLDPNTWRPYFIHISSVERTRGFYTQFNVGIGLLYYSGVKGNLAGQPASYFAAIAQDVPVQGKLSYNRTPLYEYYLGYQIKSWLKAGLSYQHQSNVAVQTAPLLTLVDTNRAIGGLRTNFVGQRSQLSADLILDGLMAKAYFEYPKALVWKNVVYSSYFGLGSGIGWQTWKRVTVIEPYLSQQNIDSITQSIRQKVSFNALFQFDIGFRMQSPFPETGFSVTSGIKFNLWGQARTLGQIQQSETPRFGLFVPFSVKSVYQWAPYVGVQWKF